jgi:hypothetical protein
MASRMSDLFLLQLCQRARYLLQANLRNGGVLVSWPVSCCPNMFNDILYVKHSDADRACGDERWVSAFTNAQGVRAIGVVRPSLES